MLLKCIEMKKCILVLAFAVSLSLNNLSAQPGFDDDVQDTPLDSGIALVLAAGVLYGIVKLHSVKDKSKAGR